MLAIWLLPITSQSSLHMRCHKRVGVGGVGGLPSHLRHEPVDRVRHIEIDIVTLLLFGAINS